MYDGNDDTRGYPLNRTDENNGECQLSRWHITKTLRYRKPTPTCWKPATAAVKEVATLGVDAEAVNGGQVAYDTVNQLNMRADLETYVFQIPATAMRAP